MVGTTDQINTVIPSASPTGGYGVFSPPGVSARVDSLTWVRVRP